MDTGLASFKTEQLEQGLDHFFNRLGEYQDRDNLTAAETMVLEMTELTIYKIQTELKRRKDFDVSRTAQRVVDAAREFQAAEFAYQTAEDNSDAERKSYMARNDARQKLFFELDNLSLVEARKLKSLEADPLPTDR